MIHRIIATAVTPVLLLLLGVMPSATVASDKCPFQSDAIRFNLEAGMITPNGFDVESACSTEELGTIADTYAAALNGPQLKPELGIQDVTAESVCPNADRKLMVQRELQIALPSLVNWFHLVQKNIGHCFYCLRDDDDSNYRKLRHGGPKLADLKDRHRRTTATGDLCGCYELEFATALAATTASTDDYLTSNGISIVGDGNMAAMEFTQPVLIDSIDATNGSDISITYVDGSEAPYDGTGSTKAATSIAILDGSVGKVEYCFEACPEALSAFDDEILDIQAELRVVVDEALNAADIPCLDGVEVLSVVHVSPVAIDAEDCA